MLGVLVPWVSRSLSSPVEQLLFSPQSVTTTRVELYIYAQSVLAAGSGVRPLVVYVRSYQCSEVRCGAYTAFLLAIPLKQILYLLGRGIRGGVAT